MWFHRQSKSSSSLLKPVDFEKQAPGRLLLIGIFTVFSLIIIFYVYGLYKKQIESGKVKSATQHRQIKKQERPGLPVRLKIPKINVDAVIEHVGISSKGEMEVPTKTVDVGWFNIGPRPGEKGSSVIAGHFDGKNGETAVFTHLDKLKKGDTLYIEDDKGISTSFIVREIRTYDPGYADDVFSPNDKAHLNLITCDGPWDGAKKSYSKRLVVFADIMQ